MVYLNHIYTRFYNGFGSFWYYCYFLFLNSFWQACSTTAYMTCICKYSTIHIAIIWDICYGRLKCAANGPSCRSWPLCLTLWCGQVSLWWRLRTRTALCAQQVRKTQGECQPQSGSRCCFSKFQWPIVVSYQLCRTWLLLLNSIAITLVMNRTYTHTHTHTHTLSWHCEGFWSGTHDDHCSEFVLMRTARDAFWMHAPHVFFIWATASGQFPWMLQRRGSGSQPS